MTNYAARTGRSPEFRIRYRWITEQEGAINQRPFQHMRSDFLYADDDPLKEGISMIWPEFEAEIGVPLEEGAKIPMEGTATMWILDAQRRPYHASRLSPGVRGYLVVGAHKIAEAEVIEILDLP